MAARPPRVVIDTNVLVLALVFKSGAMASLREAWQSGRCIPVVSRTTVEELLRTLKYPKFNLSQDEQDAILAAYLPWCEVLAKPKPRGKVPVCRDEDDVPFVLLAIAAKADVIITGDRDLLALKGTLACDVRSPAEWVAQEIGRKEA